MAGLYVHIPFCVRKCGYCDFYSVAGRSDLLDVYVRALLVEAERYHGMTFDTMYLGGGTPGLLGPRRLEMLMRGIDGIFVLGGIREATLECNPESCGPELLSTARSCGINRLSLGMQSLVDSELQYAGRIHDSARAIKAVSDAFAAGFTDISVDIIVGLPGQTLASLAQTLRAVVGLGVTHISAYCLSIEEGTPFALHPPAGMVPADAQAAFFDYSAGFLEQQGFMHYEISNFARPAYQCRHNLNYWRGGQYLGLGPSAASHLVGSRFRNCPDLDEYLLDPAGQVEEMETLLPAAKSSEEAVLRLRLLMEGLDVADLAAVYGMQNISALIGRLNVLRERGLLKGEGDTYCLPGEMVMTSNRVFIEVIE